jgi:hypothetical protein
MHGFLMQFLNITSIVYNGFLSVYYLLVIKYRFPDRKFKKAEKWFHIIPWSFGIVTAIIPAALKLYNPARWNCWISTDYKNPDDPRKELVLALQLAIFYVPLWITITLSGVCMFMIYQYVRKTELRTSVSSVVSSRLARTKQVAFQGVYFVVALMVTFCIPSIVRVISMTGGTAPRALIVLGGITAPSQGFLNAFAYFRIRATRQMRENPNTSKWRIVVGIIRAQLFPWWKPAGFLEDDGNDCEAKIDDNDDGHPDTETGASKSPAGRRATLRPSVILFAGSDWQSLRANGVNTIDSTRLPTAANRSPSSESQGQSVFPLKTLDGGGVGEDLTKTTQNEEATKKESPPNRSPSSEFQGQCVFPLKTPGGVGEYVSKTTQNEEATKKELSPNRSPTSESQGQSVFPMKTLDGGGVGEHVSKTTQNEEVTKKEDDRMDLVDDT